MSARIATLDLDRARPDAAAVKHRDLEFHEKLPKLMPHANVHGWFANLPAEHKGRAAFQGGTMQGAYLISRRERWALTADPSVDSTATRSTPRSSRPARGSRISS